MNAITAQTTIEDNTFRNDAIRRSNACGKYKIDNEKTVESRKDLLIAKKSKRDKRIKSRI